MQVTDVETYTLHVPIDGTVGDSRLEITDVYWVVIELGTDVGHTGVGWMGSLGFAPDLLERFVDSQFADALVGADPFAHEAIREELRTRTIYYGELGMSAWPRGAIDVALWDLKAKAAGVPLYRLLGGAESTVPASVLQHGRRHRPGGARGAPRRLRRGGVHRVRDQGRQPNPRGRGLDGLS